MRKLARGVAAAVLVACAPGARAAGDALGDGDEFSADDGDSSVFAPAPADAPGIRNVEPRSRIYFDGSASRATDLSALPYIAGSGHNFRVAFGGSLRVRRFQFDAELPAWQSTTIDVTEIPPLGNPPLVPEDAHQVATSIGDLRLGAQWSEHLPLEAMPLAVGVALRARFPTHTTTFQFNLVDRTLEPFRFPPFFHFEPTTLFGAALGRVSFTMNQGALIMAGPVIEFGNVTFLLPTIFFWDSHYAVAVRAHRHLGLSIEANTVIQMNRVTRMEFEDVNDIRAVFVQPAIQILLGLWRVDAIARLGLNRGSELIGVLGYGGTESLVLRLTRILD